MSAQLTPQDIQRECHGPFGLDIVEPTSWRDDGGKRVEVVVDPNWLIDGKPRVIRRIAWRRCISCKCRRFFSRDLARIRLCDVCKASPNDKS
jgi:hypothetical protein